MTTTKQQRLPEVSTRAFEAEYCKKPRGIGSWGFCPADRWNHIDYLDHVKFFHGPFGEARKAAREAFRGITTLIEVCT